jgi:hypothetical protein
VNVAFVAPAATVTLAGTVATAVLLLARVTDAPPDGAAADSVTVAVDDAPPFTLVGLSVSAEAAGAAGGGAGATVRIAVFVTPPYVAEIVAELEALTAFEATLKLAVLAPAGTVTAGGTVATAVLLLDNVTEAPPDGAADESVTVAVDEPPPVTLVGLKVSPEADGPVANGLTVSVAVFVTPAPEALIVTVVGADGLCVVMMKPPPPAN